MMDTSADGGIGESICSCIIEQVDHSAACAMAEAVQGGIALVLGVGRNGCAIDSVVARASCREAMFRLREGMRAVDAFRAARRKARHICHEAGGEEQVSLLVARTKGGVIEAEWVGSLAMLRLREEDGESACCHVAWPSEDAGLTSRRPSFAKRSVLEGDRLVVMTLGLFHSEHYLRLEMPNSSKCTTAHGYCARLVRNSLRRGIDHAAVIVADIPCDTT